MLGGVTAAEAKSSKSAKYDLVIVGAGCGGLVCAIHAAELGLKPLLLEKMPMPAGNAIYAAGFLLGLNTSFQKAKNVPADTAEAFYDDMMKVSQQKAVPALTHTVVDNCTRLLEWLHSYCGINFLTGNKLVWPQLYRSHLVTGELKPGGAQLVMTLLNKAKAMGVEVRTSTKVVELIADPKTGGVAGAKVKTKGVVSEVYAKYGVVLATGGIGANAKLVQSLRPDISADVKTSNQPGSQGDGMVLAQKIGASVTDAKEIQLNPTLLVGSPVIVSETVRGAGAVFVNKEGKRFISELTTRDVTSAAVSKQTGGVAYEIFDQKVRDKVKQTGAAFELSLAKEGNTIRELAAAAGIDPDNLEKNNDRLQPLC